MRDRNIEELIKQTTNGADLEMLPLKTQEKLLGLLSELEIELRSVLIMYKVKENESSFKLNRYIDELIISLPSDVKQMRLEDYCKSESEELF